MNDLSYINCLLYYSVTLNNVLFQIVIFQLSYFKGKEMHVHGLSYTDCSQYIYTVFLYHCTASVRGQTSILNRNILLHYCICLSWLIFTCWATPCKLNIFFSSQLDRLVPAWPGRHTPFCSEISNDTCQRKLVFSR